jgi:hypothetical protein
MRTIRRLPLCMVVAALTGSLLIIGSPGGAGANSVLRRSTFATQVARLPVAANSAKYMAAARAQMNPRYLKFATSRSWAFPIYRATRRDPVYAIHVRGKTYHVRIPKGAKPMGGSDGAMISRDKAAGKAFSLFQASFNNGKWSAGGISRTQLSTNWLDRSLGGSSHNFGHRGVPVPLMAVRKKELRNGVIRHAVEIYWYETAGTHVYPMSGQESGHTGVVPEGYFLRLKSNAGTNRLVKRLKPHARIIARALQTYGGMIGDNAGGSKSMIKVQRGVKGLSADALHSIKLKHYEFVKLR